MSTQRFICTGCGNDFPDSVMLFEHNCEPGAMNQHNQTPLPDSPDAELDIFLATLKIHNKDLDVCFYDALAVRHLKQLMYKALLSQLREGAPKKYDNYTGTDMEDYQRGHNTAVDAYSALFDKLESRL